VNIATARLEETRAFYCDVLGLEVGERPAFAVDGYWLYAGGSPIVHLQVAPEPVGAHAPALAHFALRVAALAAYEGRLQQAGLPYRRTSTPDNAFDQLFLRDPSGTMLELICPTPRSPTDALEVDASQTRE
jgi:catechol 2,3-dioxygenase-like lactoylglutathione lyase family enzyme